ncbi:hypothetical protein ANCDUO_09953 [Ancylostoma duodenale]|uniref:Uncharacterized protein n=1 Tax=Ancylostoma duodenale TaxID=51022 RepID=A0A0C2GF65_9BILA|nr:hypothetical protein ANCDUO_09953 [Ancylostoma duodenale]
MSTSLVSLSQDENAKDIFEPSSSIDDVVGPADFVGRTEEINEGSDSFAISTAMLEPITEPTTAAAPKHEVSRQFSEPVYFHSYLLSSNFSYSMENTVEPLELTTRVDKNLSSTVQLPIIPSSAEGTQPLPEEAMAADPFSLDETTTTVKTNFRAIAGQWTVHDLRRTEVFEKEFIEFYIQTAPVVPTSTSIRDSTTDFHMGRETTAPPFVTSATTENQEEAATAGVVAGMTHDGSEAEEAHTQEVDVTIDAEVTTPTLDSEATTSELPASPTTEASTSTSTTQATTTTTIDEDAAPFDQDKLSGLFEQDGSFIPEHLTNESSFEPVFPRVELPEESTEIISGPRPKQTTSTSAPELPSFVVDSQPTTVEVHIQDTTPATTTAGTQFTHQLQPIVIQPIVTKTTINEVLQMSRQPETDSDEGRHLTPVLQTSTEKEAKQEESAPTTTSTVQETSTEPTTSPTTQPVPEPTSTASSPVPEPAPESQATPQPEPGPQAD